MEIEIQNKSSVQIDYKCMDYKRNICSIEES